MGVDATKVLSGAPDQLVTGAIMSAPITTALTDANIWAGTFTGFEDSGYVSEDGVTMSLSKSFANIKDWSGATVKKILEEFDGTLKWAHLELNQNSLEDTFGEAAVGVTAATASTGTRIKVSISSADNPHKKRVIKMKDGNARVVIVLPDSQVTDLEDVQFVKTDAIKLGVTVACYPDASGNSIYIYTDDGVFSA